MTGICPTSKTLALQEKETDVLSLNIRQSNDMNNTGILKCMLCGVGRGARWGRILWLSSFAVCGLHSATLE